MAEKKITKELVELLEGNPRIEKVYFNENTGEHHLKSPRIIVATEENEKKGLKPGMYINGNPVVEMSRKDVIAAYKSKPGENDGGGSDEGKGSKKK